MTLNMTTTKAVTVKNSFAQSSHSGLIATLLIMLTLFVASEAHAQARLTVTPDRMTMADNETLSITVRYENGTSDAAPDFSAVEQSFDILGNSKSSQFINNNGQVTRFNQWSLTLAPKSTGKLLFPPLSIDQVQSQPLTIEVTKAKVLPQGQKVVFIETSVEKKAGFVQEELIVTLKLFFKENIIDVDAEPFAVKGAEVVELGQTQYQTSIGHSRYQVAQLNYSVTPKSSGTLEIPSFLWTLRTSSAPRNRFTSGSATLHRLRTDPLTITVKPRPEEYPSSAAWLPASSLKLESSWSQQPPQFKVGEPITRTIKITAQGLSGEQLPPLTNILNGEEFKFYPDQPQIESATTARGKSGHRIESMAIVPSQAGELTLPATQVAWWNTKTNKLETAELPAQTIYVSKANPADAPALAVVPEQTHVQNEPTTIKTVESPGFWPWVALGLLLINILQGVWFFSQRASRKAPTQQSADTTTDNTLPLKSALREAKKAAQNNDALACKRALNMILHNPSIKTASLPSELNAAIQELDESLYGQHAKAWDGSKVLSLLKNDVLSSNSKHSLQSHMQPLYG